MRDNPVSEDKLQKAAREYLLWELQKFDAYADYPEPEFHGSYKLQMAALRHDVKRGAIKEAEYRMGATFYIKRSIVAILLVFTMACLTMPETVLAGYQKLIEVIETVFDEYTEYRYRVNDVDKIEEFKEIKLNYIPDNLREITKRKSNEGMEILYKDNNNMYIRMYQRKLTAKTRITYLFDLENDSMELVKVKNDYVQFNYKQDEIYLVWQYDNYRINIQTNLKRDVVVNILNNIDI